MNLKTYRFITLGPALIFLFIIFFLQNKYLLGIYILPQNILFAVIILKSALALFVFFTGIYFLKSNVPKGKDIPHPYWSIFIGILFILLSYGSTISSYAMIHNIPDTKLKYDHLQKLKIVSLDNSRSFANREACARIFYIETGKKIKILNSDGSIDYFKPNTETVLKREKNIQTEKTINRIILFTKKIFFYEFFILLLFLITFVLILKKFPPKSCIVYENKTKFIA